MTRVKTKILKFLAERGVLLITFLRTKSKNLSSIHTTYKFLSREEYCRKVLNILKKCQTIKFENLWNNEIFLKKVGKIFQNLIVVINQGQRSYFLFFFVKKSKIGSENIADALSFMFKLINEFFLGFCQADENLEIQIYIINSSSNIFLNVIAKAGSPITLIRFILSLLSQRDLDFLFVKGQYFSSIINDYCKGAPLISKFRFISGKNLDDFLAFVKFLKKFS
ncbi:MAG: hypothetical protein ACTSVA_09375 [Candidatus Njordarchaeales archaeon]